LCQARTHCIFFFLQEWGSWDGNKKAAATNIHEFTCWAHLSELFINEGCVEEKKVFLELTKEPVSDEDSTSIADVITGATGERLEPDVNSLIRSHVK